MKAVTSPTMDGLKEATRDLHRHAETRELQRQLVRGDLPRDTFSRYLGQLYLVHSALEASLGRSRDRHTAIAAVATADRMRKEDLEADLAFHGLDCTSVVAGPAARDFVRWIERREVESPVALLGCLYVLEGSTNGSRFIARVLRGRWGLEDGGLAYLDPYGEEQPARWGAFKRDMEAADLAVSEVTVLTEAARTTFEAIAAVSDELVDTAPA